MSQCKMLPYPEPNIILYSPERADLRDKAGFASNFGEDQLHGAISEKDQQDFRAEWLSG